MKKGQEEIFGFALIVVTVAVILLVFLGLSLRSPGKETVESYEVESFLQAMLQYTSDCSNGAEYMDVQKLIFSCDAKDSCVDGRECCDVLSSVLERLLEEGWEVGEDTPVKGYELSILSGEDEQREVMLVIEDGEEMNSSKGAMQNFVKSGKNYDIYFKAYY